jgi:hypothetical protein
VISTAPAVFHRVNVAIMVVSRLGETFDLRWLTHYAIASPRGPPLSV